MTALFTNDYFWHELIHLYVAGYIVTGFVFAAPYAWARLRGRWTRYERTAFVVPLAVAALASPVHAGSAIPKQTRGMWTANDRACICRASSRYLCATEAAASDTASRSQQKRSASRGAYQLSPARPPPPPLNRRLVNRRLTRG